MRRIAAVVAIALASMLLLNMASVSFATHKGNACPPKSHDPGGEPNCGQPPVPSPTPSPVPTPTPPPEVCPDVSGPVTGIIIEVAGEVGAPAEDVLIEVACLVYELTEL